MSFGHVYLEHDFNNKDLYDKYEVEANYFAAQLLMPEQILREFQNRGKRIDEEFLQKNFGVSRSAAEKKMDNLFKITWVRNEEETIFDDIILGRYMKWINSIVPEKTDYDSYFYEEELRQEREQWEL